MNTHRRILMTMAAVIIIAAMGMFARCKKEEIKVSVVSICPTSVMIYVGETTTLLANVMPSNANDRSVTWKSDNENVATVIVDGIVMAIATGEAAITCTTNDGGHPATSTVIVNPKKNDEDYATLMPYFYFGDMMMAEENVGENKLITVKYDSENKVVLSIDEKFKVPQMENIEMPMKVDCIADVIKVGNGYEIAGKTSVIMMSMEISVNIEGVFNNNVLDLNIDVELPDAFGGGNITVNFKGTGNMMINPCMPPD